MRRHLNDRIEELKDEWWESGDDVYSEPIVYLRAYGDILHNLQNATFEDVQNLEASLIEHVMH